ncbi:hypothetical protein ALC53_13425 [Atta colombica]|uniref:Uncharacterized protein n=1 Tax=Atta colombica TaxID=520822 RepID=A0A195AW24_9HYME|nr:hypothetical protein ALC53_13425 [Atta colombica]
MVNGGNAEREGKNRPKSTKMWNCKQLLDEGGSQTQKQLAEQLRIILANPIQSNIIRSGRFKLKIFTDASLTRSGAVIYEHIGFNHLRINKTTLILNLIEIRIFSEETEWVLNQGYFDIIIEHFGRVDIDLFATSINTKYPKFVS